MKMKMMGWNHVVQSGALLGLATGCIRRRSLPKVRARSLLAQALPNNWMLGQVSGITVDSHDHIWVTSRPRTLDNNDKYAALDPPKATAASPRRRWSNSIGRQFHSRLGWSRPRL